MALPDKTCRAKCKDDHGKEYVCGTTLKGECRNRKNHVYPYPSGYCGVGAHEGIKILGANGKPLKTCGFWKTCSCECHKMYDLMFSESGMKRDVVDFSEYSHEPTTFWMPTLEERAAMLAVQKEKVKDIKEILEESPLPEVIPSTYKHKFTPTPTGRAARGELESFVKAVCDEHIVEKYSVICTPAYIAEQIAKIRDGAPPSQGAVNAVFERWQKIGFADIAHKPTRFVGYTPDGVRLGLDAMKLRAKKHAESPAAQFQKRSAS